LIKRLPDVFVLSSALSSPKPSTTRANLTLLMVLEMFIENLKGGRYKDENSNIWEGNKKIAMEGDLI